MLHRPLVISPLAIAFAIIWGGVLGFLRLPLAAFIGTATCISVISLWQDRKFISFLNTIRWVDDQPTRLGRRASLLLGLPLVFLAALAVTLTFQVLAYWPARWAHLISN